LQIGKLIEVEGQFRSYNNYDNPEGSKLILTVFAREIRFLEDDKKSRIKSIFLNGFICKKPVYRTTPLEGKLRIYCWLSTDRTINRTTYRVFAGKKCQIFSRLEVGQNIKIWGRIQSREYQKKLDTGEVVTKVAFEVSVSKMEVCDK